VLNAGTNVLVGTFTPTDTGSYSSGGTITNTVVVGKGSHTISFGSLTGKQVGDAAFSLAGTSSSGLAVTYTSSNPNVATVSGSMVTIVGAGTTVITASQAGNWSWNAASEVAQTLTVLPRTVLTISGASVNGKEYDGNRTANVDFSLAELVGVAGGHDVSLVSGGGVATYESANAGVGKSVSVTGLTLSGADAGRYEIGPALLLSGDISKKSLTVGNVSVVEKRYDGEVVAPLSWSNHTLSGYANGEGSVQAYVGTPYARGKYQDAWVGTNKSVIGWFELPVLVGSGKDNYKLVFPSNLKGTVLKGWAGVEIQNVSQVYGRTNRVVSVAVTNLNGISPVLEVSYEGTNNGVVYGPSSNGPVNAGSYRVVAKVSETDNTYEGSNTAVLTIGKKAGVIVAKSDTIRAGTGFNAGNYSASGFLSGDEPSGSLVTHLRSVTNTNPLVGYQSSSVQGGVYRILRGSVGDNVSQNYSIEYREGTLTVLKDSILTEGTVVPLAAGFNYTLVVQSGNRTVSAFGGNSNVVGVVPAILTNGTAEVAGVGSGAGNNFGMAWTRDGQPVVWGGTPGVTPVGLTNIAAMAGGNGHVVYLKEDGTVGGWGTNSLPATVPGVVNSSKVVGVAAGESWSLAVRSNGSVVGWGTTLYGLTNVPVMSNGVGVAAGNYHGLVLKADGTVAAWGSSALGVTNVPGELTNRMTNTFVRAVSAVAGYQYTLVLRADGSVRGWGSGAPTNLPASLTSTMGTNPIVSLGVEQNHAVALQRDGTVVVWGSTNGLVTNVAVGLKGRVPMGGADSDGDGWSNEAELRVGSDAMSRTSQPVKASFGVTFNYGSGGSVFETSRVVSEGTNRVVGGLVILDTMGRLENGNQAEMTVELGQEAQKVFELVGKELRFKSSPVYDGVTGNNIYNVDVLVRDSSNSATLTTTLDVVVDNAAPQIMPGTPLVVDENVVLGTGVGTLQASEGNVSWSITSGNELGLFAIDGQTGQIKVAGAIDYEALSNKTITLGVRVSDGWGASGSANVTITVRDVLEGMTWGPWLAGVTGTPELLLKYAIGGATSPTGSSESTLTVLDSNKLSLTAVVRTNDVSLSVVGEAGASLSSWSSSGVSVAASLNQASVPEGCQRKVYSVDRTNSPTRQFLRLRVSR